MRENIFCIQLGSYSIKYGNSINDDPEEILNAYIDLRNKENTRDLNIESHLENIKDEFFDYEEIKNENEEIQLQQPKKEEIKMNIDLFEKFTDNLQGNFLFGKSAIQYGLEHDIEYKEIFPYGRLNKIYQKENDELIQEFFKALLMNENLEKTSVLISIPFYMTKIEINYLAKVFLKNIGVYGVSFQLESIANLYALRLSSLCFVDLGKSFVKISCMRDGFEIYKTRVLLPVGSFIQDLFLTSFLNNEKINFNRKLLIAEKIKENLKNNAYSNKQEINCFKFDNYDNEIEIPPLDNILANMFFIRDILEKLSKLNESKKIFELFDFWNRIKENKPKTNNIEKIKERWSYSLSNIIYNQKEINKKRRKYSPELIFLEGTNFESEIIDFECLEDLVFRSICSTGEMREILFYSQQIVFLGGGSNTKRLSFFLERALTKKFKEKYPEIKPSILKINSKYDKRFLSWYGLKELSKIENLDSILIKKGFFDNENIIENTLIIDYHNLNKYNMVKNI